ncbi:DUF4054 domain-containing protein [Methylorubrum aminovorans]|uniref:DUF4054 domain-containing protein n=1 Tax=Methylorubrum aminovorans TaxID=269069 RepID=UPI003C2DB89A
MAYIAPTAEDLKKRFPAFSAVGADPVAGALQEAERQVDDTWPADDRVTGVLLYAAHVLTLDGLGTSTEAQLAGFRRLKIGSLELESATAAASASSSPLLQTGYGRRFADLAKRVRGPAILVV